MLLPGRGAVEIAEDLFPIKEELPTGESLCSSRTGIKVEPFKTNTGFKNTHNDHGGRGLSLFRRIQFASQVDQLDSSVVIEIDISRNELMQWIRSG
jgi:hypothetical protein